MDGLPPLTPPPPTRLEMVEELTKRVAAEFQRHYGVMIFDLADCLDSIRAEVGLPPIDYTVPI